MHKLKIFNHGLTFHIDSINLKTEDYLRFAKYSHAVNLNKALKILESIDYDISKLGIFNKSRQEFLRNIINDPIITNTLDIVKETGIKGWQIADQEAYREIKEEDIPETIPPHNFSPEIIDENLDQLRSQFLTVLKQK